MLTKVKQFFGGFKKRFKGKKRVRKFINKRPFESFFVALGILLLLIIASNVLGTPKPAQNEAKVAAKGVQVYTLQGSPTLTMQAQISKSGVVHINSLTSGVVQRILRTEGQSFGRGQTLVILSTNYQGGNAPALQSKIAQLQFKNAEDTFQLQKDLISRQRDLATELNKQSKETDFSKVQKDVTNKQLDIQDKSIDLNKDVAMTQLQLAQVTEAMMYPSAPFNGTVQKVSVKVGQAVVPGQELMIISENVKDDPVTAAVFVSPDIISALSTSKPSAIYLKGTVLELTPFYVTQDAVSGQLYAIYFDIPEKYRSLVTENQHVRVDLTLEKDKDDQSKMLIPIDAVYQTKDRDYVFVVVNDRAEIRTVRLGAVYGSFVEVLSGISNTDQVILNRNVIAGDRVVVQ